MLGHAEAVRAAMKRVFDATPAEERVDVAGLVRVAREQGSVLRWEAPATAREEGTR